MKKEVINEVEAVYRKGTNKRIGKRQKAKSKKQKAKSKKQKAEAKNKNRSKSVNHRGNGEGTESLTQRR